jgi:hypothetical protein
MSTAAADPQEPTPGPSRKRAKVEKTDPDTAQDVKPGQS